MPKQKKGEHPFVLFLFCRADIIAARKCPEALLRGRARGESSNLAQNIMATFKTAFFILSTIKKSGFRLEVPQMKHHLNVSESFLVRKIPRSSLRGHFY
jgi:hypothetical protein